MTKHASIQLRFFGSGCILSVFLRLSYTTCWSDTHVPNCPSKPVNICSQESSSNMHICFSCEARASTIHIDC